MRQTPEQRFWGFVEPQENGCWLWRACIAPNRYGLFFDGKLQGAHRWAYRHFCGEIPEGNHVHHNCGVHACVNPAHLEALSAKDHLRRGDTFQARNAAKTHCAHGHPFAGANLWEYRGRRVCLICKHARWYRWHARKVAKEA